MICIYYTADVVRPDGSDTGVYGDPCEPGDGTELEMGWLSPDWSRFTVYENREDVRPDTYGPADGPVIDWIIDRLANRVGAPYVEDNGDGTFYAADSAEDYHTGAAARIAAHVEAPPAILCAVSYAIAYQYAHRF